MDNGEQIRERQRIAIPQATELLNILDHLSTACGVAVSVNVDADSGRVIKAARRRFYDPNPVIK